MPLTCQGIFLHRNSKNIWNNVVIIIYWNLVIPNLFHLLCYHVIHCKNPSSMKWFLLIIEQYMHLRQKHIWILLNLPHIQSTVSHTSNFSVLAVNWSMWNFSKKHEIKFQFFKWTFFPLSRKIQCSGCMVSTQVKSYLFLQFRKLRHKDHTKNMTVQGQMRNLHSVIKSKAARSWIPKVDIFQNSCLQIVEEMLESCLLLSESTAWA